MADRCRVDGTVKSVQLRMDAASLSLLSARYLLKKTVSGEHVLIICSSGAEKGKRVVEVWLRIREKS